MSTSVDVNVPSASVTSSTNLLRSQRSRAKSGTRTAMWLLVAASLILFLIGMAYLSALVIADLPDIGQLAGW